MSDQLTILQKFIEVFCWKQHGSNKGELCPECSELFEYAKKKLENCPHDPKPKCKDCMTHCYKPVYRQQIKEIMKFSGMYFVKRGRIDWLIKYFK